MISVIIPAYNIEKWIGRCLESVCGQTYRELEIIVVDDGSTDGTGKVIDSYAERDLRIKAIHKENGGVTSARLAGVGAATGDWIGFVDGDDLLEPDMYERLLDNALKYGADISHCGYKMVFPSGRIDLYYNTGDFALQNKKEALSDLLSGERIEPGLVTKLFKKDLFCGIIADDIIPLDIKINEDLLMNYYLFREADISVYEDICPYNYMLREGSAATAKKRIHITDPIRVLDMIRNDACEDRIIYQVAYSRYIRSVVVATCQSEFSEVSKDSQEKLKNEIRRGEIKKCGLKLRMMAFGAAYMLPIYRGVRLFYDKITGVSNKYSLDRPEV